MQPWIAKCRVMGNDGKPVYNAGYPVFMYNDDGTVMRGEQAAELPVFTVASGLCGLTPSGDIAQTWLIVFRAAQGIGAAILLPAALAIVVGIVLGLANGTSLVMLAFAMMAASILLQSYLDMGQ